MPVKLRSPQRDRGHARWLEVLIGTSRATIIAMYGGFTATFLRGAAFYAVAGLLGIAVSRHYIVARAAGEPAPASPAVV